MLYRLMIVLVLCSLVSAATTIGCLVGGSSSSNENAGWFDSTAVAVADTFAANGASVDSDNGGAVTEGAGSKVLITDTNQFGNTAVGMFIRVDFDALHVDGRFEIIAVTDDDAVLIDLDYGGDESVNNWNVGGAVPIIDGTFELQDVLDDPTFGTAASRNVDIYATGTGILTATLDLDTGGGSATTRKRLWACNTSYVYTKDGLTLTTTTTLANGLVKITTEDYFEFYGVVFDGGGKDASRAAYGVYAPGLGDGLNSVFENCTFTGASSDGYAVRGSSTTVFRCDAYENGRYGFSTLNTANNTWLSFCTSRDNDGHGFFVRITNGGLVGNVSYDNGKDGTGVGFQEVSSSHFVKWISNTSYGNADSGFNIHSNSTRHDWINNTSVGNGTYGYNFNGANIDSVTQYFAYNHASVNTTAHTDAVADGAFANLKQGNNINGSQSAANIFVSVVDGSEDFTPKAGSDLIDAGLDVQDTPTVDIGAIQLDGAGGAGNVIIIRRQ